MNRRSFLAATAAVALSPEIPAYTSALGGLSPELHRMWLDSSNAPDTMIMSVRVYRYMMKLTDPRTQWLGMSFVRYPGEQWKRFDPIVLRFNPERLPA